MTGAAFDRPGASLFVAPLAVGMQRIPALRVAVRAVAILPAAGTRILLLFMVALIAGDSVPALRRMGLVIEKDLSRYCLEHDPDGFVRGLLGIGRITDHPYDEHDGCQTECKP